MSINFRLRKEILCVSTDLFLAFSTIFLISLYKLGKQGDDMIKFFAEKSNYNTTSILISDNFEFKNKTIQNLLVNHTSFWGAISINPTFEISLFIILSSFLVASMIIGSFFATSIKQYDIKFCLRVNNILSCINTIVITSLLVSLGIGIWQMGSQDYKITFGEVKQNNVIVSSSKGMLMKSLGDQYKFYNIEESYCYIGNGNSNSDRISNSDGDGHWYCKLDRNVFEPKANWHYLHSTMQNWYTEHYMYWIYLLGISFVVYIGITYILFPLLIQCDKCLTDVEDNISENIDRNMNTDTSLEARNKDEPEESSEIELVSAVRTNSNSKNFYSIV